MILLKFLAKLKKLKLKKPKNKKSNIFYNYHIVTEYENLTHLKGLNLINLEKKDELISFDCSKKILQQIKKLNVPILSENIVKRQFNKKSRFKKISIIGLLVLIILFLINQFFIREIVFAKNAYYDEKIYQTVKEYTTKVGPYYKLNTNINLLSKNLRTKFYYYGYVGVYKKGSKLLIDVRHNDILNTPEKPEVIYGEILAKYNARIDLVKMSSGVVLKFSGETVKKGEILVTSNLKYQENLYQKESFVPLVGVVLGTTFRYLEISIKKNEKVLLFSGQEKSSFQLKIGNKIIGKINNPFSKTDGNDYTILSNDFLSLFSKFKLLETTVYERRSMDVFHSFDEAKTIAYYKIYQAFEKDKIDDSEKILNINLLDTRETSEEFIFNFILNAYENIGEYRSF